MFFFTLKHMQGYHLMKNILILLSTRNCGQSSECLKLFPDGCFGAQNEDMSAKMRTYGNHRFKASSNAHWTQLKHMYQHMPTDPQYTYAEWQKIMSNQEVKEEVGALYPGTEPQPEDAGSVSVDIKGRIIGGSAASRGQFPWQAAIIMDGSSFCGGSLIASTWVLTAAHCTQGISSFTVTLGATSVSTSQTGTVVQTTRNKVQHTGYSASTINNDISLLRLANSVSSTTYISTVRLPSTSQAGNTFAGSSVRISGWGLTSGSGTSISNNLNFVDLTVITNTQCAASFGSIITATKICTTGVNGKSPCNGDSGGPLVILESDGKYTEVGIVSFGSNGCLPTAPAAFTRVTSYLSWISQNTGLKISA